MYWRRVGYGGGGAERTRRYARNGGRGADDDTTGDRSAVAVLDTYNAYGYLHPSRVRDAANNIDVQTIRVSLLLLSSLLSVVFGSELTRVDRRAVRDDRKTVRFVEIFRGRNSFEIVLP